MRHHLYSRADGFPVLLLLSLAAIVAEAVWRVAIARKGYDLKGAAATLAVSIGHLVFEALGSVVLAAAFAAAARLAPWHWPLRDWRTWAVGFVAVEFAYYWSHRLSQRCGGCGRPTPCTTPPNRSPSCRRSGSPGPT